MGRVGFTDLVSLSYGAKEGLSIVIYFSSDLKKKPRSIIGKHVNEILKTPIEYEKLSRYKLSWSDYLMFANRDETHATSGAADVFEGNCVRKFSKSRFLDTILEQMLCPEMLLADQPKQPIHWGIYCLNDIVDVIAFGEPTVEVEPGE